MHVLPTHLVAFTSTTNKNADQLFTTYFILFSVSVDSSIPWVFLRIDLDLVKLIA